ncbi:putative 43kDa postsynaptic protein [Rosa chinensis]|uniref:Putative 43kDa postsynaptic protein n=1 Tax=Rosa chinensis TaxID=74649 RepID=A0A2P6QPV9_ROSCH|nr:stress-induced-phosphoprotein 1 [Rosa chinensis]PRQ36203.1 putative 43kDa postsynaptic protein [Rosa chinensis]
MEMEVWSMKIANFLNIVEKNAKEGNHTTRDILKEMARDFLGFVKSGALEPEIERQIGFALEKYDLVEAQWTRKIMAADRERKKGNEYMDEKKYEQAVKHYCNSIECNPADTKAYSNRALAYLRLGKKTKALEDAEKCIELDPKFSRGYLRKGSVLFNISEFTNALHTFQEGLKHNPTDRYLIHGVQQCLERLNKAGSRGATKNKSFFCGLKRFGKASSRVVDESKSLNNEHHIVDIPPVDAVSPKPCLIELKLTNVILSAEAAALVSDNLELRFMSMMCSFVAVCGLIEILRHRRLIENKLGVLKLICASVMLIYCTIMYATSKLHKILPHLESFGREAWPFHACVIIASILFNN